MSALDFPLPVQVIPVLKEVRTKGELAVWVSSLERWTDSFYLRFMVGLQRIQRQPPRVIWHAEDDVGPGYISGGAGAAAGPGWGVYSQRFTPAIPAEASTLRLEAFDEANDFVGTLLIHLAEG